MFKGGCEIFQTFQYFGSGASANRVHIVSKRIKKIIEENILKGANFIPVLHQKYLAEDLRTTLFAKAGVTRLRSQSPIGARPALFRYNI